MNEKMPQNASKTPEQADVIFETRLSEVNEKYQAYGPLFLTLQDHKDMGSSRSDWVGASEGMREYEMYSDLELEDYLNERVHAIHETKNASLLPILRHEVVATIRLLKKVGRLPEKYTDFDTKSIEE